MPCVGLKEKKKTPPGGRRVICEHSIAHQRLRSCVLTNSHPFILGNPPALFFWLGLLDRSVLTPAGKSPIGHAAWGLPHVTLVQNHARTYSVHTDFPHVLLLVSSASLMCCEPESASFATAWLHPHLQRDRGHPLLRWALPDSGVGAAVVPLGVKCWLSSAPCASFLGQIKDLHYEEEVDRLLCSFLSIRWRRTLSYE